MSCSLMRRGVILRVTSSEPLLDQLAEHHSYDPEEMEFESNTLDSLSRSRSLSCVWREEMFIRAAGLPST
jgi:hypothetical protein